MDVLFICWNTNGICPTHSENTKSALCASSHLCPALCKDREQGVREEHFPSTAAQRAREICTTQHPQHTPSNYSFPVYPETLPVHSLCFKQASEEADGRSCVISDTKYFISMQQWWRQVGRINPLKCRTGISRWRGKPSRNRNHCFPFFLAAPFLFHF